MRVTIDLDEWWFQELQNCIFKAYSIGLGFPDVLKKSPSGYYHLIWFGTPYTNEEVAEIRRYLGDDTRRVDRDLTYEGKPKQVLFSKKEKKVLVMK